MRTRRTDLVAASAAGFIAVLIAVYLSIIRSQSGKPVMWFLVVLVAAARSPGVNRRRDPLLSKGGSP
jgi:hypothetical protein